MTTPYTHPPPPAAPHMQSQSFTTILLPPPVQADTLSIHEYRPPPIKEPESKRQNSNNSNSSHASNARSHAPSHSVTPPNQNPSGSTPPIHAKPSTLIPAPSQPTPYGNTSAAPTVPATFASIMNAYPPQPSVREESQVQSRPGSREEPAGRPVRE